MRSGALKPTQRAHIYILPVWKWNPKGHSYGLGGLVPFVVYMDPLGQLVVVRNSNDSTNNTSRSHRKTTYNQPLINFLQAPSLNQHTGTHAHTCKEKKQSKQRQRSPGPESAGRSTESSRGRGKTAEAPEQLWETCSVALMGNGCLNRTLQFWFLCLWRFMCWLL